MHFLDEGAPGCIIHDKILIESLSMMKKHLIHNSCDLMGNSCGKIHVNAFLGEKLPLTSKFYYIIHVECTVHGLRFLWKSNLNRDAFHEKRRTRPVNVLAKEEAPDGYIFN